MRTGVSAAIVGFLLLAPAHLLRAQGTAPAAPDPESPAPAAFLGMAIATRITSSPDGLTEVDGIHNAIWATTFPVKENLRVYTRWNGTGSHAVDVRIVDRSSDVILAETSDRIDFGDETVTWFDHDLSAATFPGEGVYAVEVSLDGQPTAAYALYVNAVDQLPEQPAFVISVPVERAMLDRQGNAQLTGIFEYFSFPSFPARDSFSIATVWFSGQGRFDHSVEITDEAGAVVARSAALTLVATHGGMSVATAPFESVVFPSPGIYTATIFLRGVPVLSYPLVIRGR